MAWDVEYTDEFEAWWIGLDEEEQIDIDALSVYWKKKDLICRTHTVRISKGPGTAQ